MQIKDLLLRLGTENLIKLIDDDLFKILKIRNTSLASQKNLASLVFNLNSGAKLFKNKILYYNTNANLYKNPYR